MPAPPPDVTAALLERSTRMQDGLLERLAAFVRNVLSFVRSQGGDAPVADAVEQIVDAVEAGRRQAADLTAAYVQAALAIDADAGQIAPPDRDELLAEWTDLVERYVAEGGSDVVAEAEAILREDIGEARSDATETRAAIGYRRVIHPEMAQGGSCGLCVAASYRLYRVANLKPIHDNCSCTVLPVTEDSDPGGDLNDADLERVYAAAGTTDGWTLKQARFKRDRNGDLEAVRERKSSGKRGSQGQRRTSKATTRAYEQRTPEQIEALIGRLEKSLTKTRESAKRDGRRDWRDYITSLEQQIARQRELLTKQHAGKEG